MRRIEDAGRGAGRHGGTWGRRVGIRVAALASIASLVSAALLVPATASAHGPTVEIRATGLAPALLNLFEGTTVHFANTIDAQEGLVVLVDEAGKVRSPILKVPGDGWHYTFEESGRYSIRLEQRPEAKMTIVVVPKRAN